MVESMIKAIGAACVILAVLGSEAWAANCDGRRFPTLNNQTVPGWLYAVSGKRCSINVARSKGPVFGAKLVSPPSHGTASIRGTRVFYVSRPGFIGEDHFSFALIGQDMLNNPITRTVDMTVQVSDHL